MFLKSLTLKGFKSFGDTTTLEFEPGVTVVVGPNGSGKSNLVDAVAWVLGAQGPKALRSGKMDDVIFAGTARRPPLGRAEVSLTIDNSSRRLPIEASEVTVTRTLFRTGDSEYAINGATCRLLDVQELFSDAGVGRQQHVIVGQGQLDQVLMASAEDRRAMIEEAAGIRKFRRRRERAERRLETTAANLVRLGDLLREVRREQRPLERQAEAARRHDGLVAELRAVRAYQAGRELAELERRARVVQLEQARVTDTVAAFDSRLRELDSLIEASDVATAARRSGDARLAASKLDALRQRVVGLGTLVAERQRAASVELERDAGQAIGMLEADRAELVTALAEAETEATQLSPEWDDLVGEEARLDAERAEAVAAVGARPTPSVPSTSPGSGAAVAQVSLGRARADAASQRQALAHSRETLARVSERASSLGSRRADLVAALAANGEAIESAGHRQVEAREESAAAQVLAVAAVERAESLGDALRSAEQERHAAAARAETLAAALDEARARAGLERLAGVEGVLGTIHDLVEIDAGFEAAFEAAAEGALEAVVVDGTDNARIALESLRRAESSGAVIVARSGAGAGARVDEVDRAGDGDTAGSSDGMVELRRHVASRSRQVSELLDLLLSGVVCCRGGFDEAVALAVEDHARTVVTMEGDRFGRHGWKVGTAGSSASRAALERAEATASAAAAASEALGEEALAASADAASAKEAASQSAATVAQLEAERERLASTRSDLEVQLAGIDAALEANESERLKCEQLTLAHGKQLLEVESLVTELELAEAAAAAQVAAEREVEAAFEQRGRALGALRSDLEVRAAALEERRTMLTRRTAEIDERLSVQEVERAEAAARRESAETRHLALARLSARLAELVALLDDKVALAALEVERTVAGAEAASAGLAAARQQRAGVERELAEVRERERRLGIEEAEVRLRQETRSEAIGRDLEMQPEEALEAPKPELPDGVTPAARARELDRELRLLGPVNPLAEAELKALVERTSFLDRELEDVRSARRELGRVIRAIDAEIASVFDAAFADVSGHFEALVATLFPGGSGRLSLTPAESPLDAGVEIEAKPAGRPMRRLSLLSGGERSLVALAYLFAVFRSRPSPFYLLDEVEAALDDINLHRFLDLLDEFRVEAQLIIVSHQKRTMEAADALYGVTMAPGGTSKVVSERVTRAGSAAASA
jgi:chromosome segregation protein